MKKLFLSATVLLLLNTKDLHAQWQGTTTLTTTGNVGIGTSAPGRLLDLYGTGGWSGTGGMRLQGNNPGIEIIDVPSKQRWLIANGVNTGNDGFLGLAYDATASRHNIVVTPSGNVGIGTTTPRMDIDRTSITARAYCPAKGPDLTHLSFRELNI